MGRPRLMVPRYMIRSQRIAAGGGLLVLMFITGCGGTYDSSVSGTVTLDGEPVSSATIAFFPATQGPSAYARSDDAGNYQLRVGQEIGLPSGDYQVTVVASEAAVVPPDWSGPPPPGKLITPAKYGRKQDSGLRFTVNPGKNEIDLELSSTAS